MSQEESQSMGWMEELWDEAIEAIDQGWGRRPEKSRELQERLSLGWVRFASGFNARWKSLADKEQQAAKNWGSEDAEKKLIAGESWARARAEMRKLAEKATQSLNRIGRRCAQDGQSGARAWMRSAMEAPECPIDGVDVWGALVERIENNEDEEDELLESIESVMARWPRGNARDRMRPASAAGYGVEGRWMSWALERIARGEPKKRRFKERVETVMRAMAIQGREASSWVRAAERAQGGAAWKEKGWASLSMEMLWEWPEHFWMMMAQKADPKEREQFWGRVCADTESKTQEGKLAQERAALAALVSLDEEWIRDAMRLGCPLRQVMEKARAATQEEMWGQAWIIEGLRKQEGEASQEEDQVVEADQAIRAMQKALAKAEARELEGQARAAAKKEEPKGARL